MPNRHLIVLKRSPGTDVNGYTGLEDEVDNHRSTLFKAAILSVILCVGSDACRRSEGSSSLAMAIPPRRVSELQSDRRAGRWEAAECPNALTLSRDLLLRRSAQRTIVANRYYRTMPSGLPVRDKYPSINTDTASSTVIAISALVGGFWMFQIARRSIHPEQNSRKRSGSEPA